MRACVYDFKFVSPGQKRDNKSGIVNKAIILRKDGAY